MGCRSGAQQIGIERRQLTVWLNIADEDRTVGRGSHAGAVVAEGDIGILGITGVSRKSRLARLALDMSIEICVVSVLEPSTAARLNWP